VRPRGKRFQLVAGERRFRAAELAGLKTVRCTVRELGDKEAAECQLIENVHREDLNPIEIAVGLQVLLDMGHSIDTLAELVGAEKSLVGARLGLLRLPDEWQKRIREGKLTAAQAEYLLPWSDRPTVLAALATVPAKDLPLCEWKHRVISAAMEASRSMDPKAPDGPLFELTPDNLRRLDVVTIELQPGKTVRRAFAVEVWGVLQDDAGRSGSEPAPAASGNGRSNGHANGKLRAAAPRKTANLAGGNFGEPVLLDGDADQADFDRRLREWTAAFLRRLCQDVITAATPFQLPAIAEALGVDAVGAWRMRRDFLELFTGERLEALARDLGANVAMCRDDRERVAVLLATSPRAVPTIFREALESAGEKPAEHAA
jgi:ParB/RepB/Spo0J family partition protein